MNSTIDPFNIRTTTNWVMSQARHVKINPNQLNQLSSIIKQAITNKKLLTQTQFGTLANSPQKIFILDTVNFCFWAKKNQPKWQVEYPKNRITDGWQALVACFDRALKQNIPILDAEYLSQINLKQTQHLFRSYNPTPIPLLNQRRQFLRQSGRILTQRFNGQFNTLINQANLDAVKITQTIIKHFPSFRDSTVYKNKTIYFYKRAQICAYDLSLLPNLKLKNLDQLTIFADYKLPQLLRHFKVLNYSPALAKKIDAYQLITKNSPKETEIRAAIIQTGELLAQRLHVLPALIDNCLWELSQGQRKMQPYHRCLTTNY